MAAQRRKRRPLLAALLSLLVHGLGPFYNGRLKWALAFLGAGVAFVLAAFAIVRSGLAAHSFAALAGFGTFVLGLNSYHIPSHGMEPTVEVGDFIFAAPITDRDRPPERGDVVIFRLTNEGEEVDYIKRIVGLPGDRVQMRGGVLHINGESVERERTGDYALDRGFVSPDRVAMYRETLPTGVGYYILERTDMGFLDNTPEFTVPPGHYFVLGDNRDNSQDSRSQRVGFVPAGNLIGRATYIWYSTAARDAWIFEVWKWLPATRLDRIGARIQ